MDRSTGHDTKEEQKIPVTNAEESVVFENVKVNGGKPSYEMGLANEDSRQIGAVHLADVVSDAALRRQIATNQMQTQFHLSNQLITVGNSIAAQAAKGLMEPDPIESVATTRLLTGDDTAQKIANLLSTLDAGQIGAKVAQTTPPETGGGLQRFADLVAAMMMAKMAGQTGGGGAGGV